MDKIIKAFYIIEKDVKLQEELSKKETIEEVYEYCTSISGGYTKEEFTKFLIEKLSNISSELKEKDLQKICGGINLNRKTITSALLSAIAVASPIAQVSASKSSVQATYNNTGKEFEALLSKIMLNQNPQQQGISELQTKWINFWHSYEAAWEAVRDTEYDAIAIAAYRAVKDPAWKAAGEAAGEAAWVAGNAADYAAWDAARYATWYSDFKAAWVAWVTWDAAGEAAWVAVWSDGDYNEEVAKAIWDTTCKEYDVEENVKDKIWNGIKPIMQKRWGSAWEKFKENHKSDLETAKQNLMNVLDEQTEKLKKLIKQK